MHIVYTVIAWRRPEISSETSIGHKNAGLAPGDK